MAYSMAGRQRLEQMTRFNGADTGAATACRGGTPSAFGPVMERLAKGVLRRRT